MVSENADKVIKKEQFKRMTFTSSKKYFCSKGELTLTSKGLLIDCEGNWSRFLPFSRFSFESWGENLEVYDLYYHKLRFRFMVDKPKEWEKAIQAILYEQVRRNYRSFETSITEAIETGETRFEKELKKLFDINPKALKDLHKNVRKEMDEYESKNIRFNLEVQDKLEKVKDQKLKAFMVAHIYVAWYEWLKNLLYKIHKAKLGKGPDNDNELLKFLEDYPSLKHRMDTSEWGMNPNQMRNCVAHERFFFDYKTGELVFMARKEKRVRLIELRFRIRPMIYFYFSILDHLRNAEKS